MCCAPPMWSPGNYLANNYKARNSSYESSTTAEHAIASI